MLDFIFNNFAPCASVVLSVLLLFYAIATKQWAIVKIAAYRLMLSAQKLMETKEGKDKMEYVYTVVTKITPNYIMKFISEETLRKKLQEWYDLTKDDLGK